MNTEFRERVWESFAGNMVCRFCGIQVDRAAPMNSPNRATLEHLVPLVRGGTSRKSNLGLACKPCNVRKGRLTEEEFLAFKEADAREIAALKEEIKWLRRELVIAQAKCD